jgi:putative spermidine/putrescine transport system substrate-binding protein
MIRLPTTRRQFLAGTGAALAAGAAPGALAQKLSCSQVVVGTWGGDYENLLGANIHKPLLEPQKIEVVTDVGSQDPRKTKLIAERNSKRGTLDVACLSDVDMFQIAQQNVFMDLDETLVPNMKNVLPKLRKKYSVPQIYSGRVVVYNAEKVKPAPVAYADLWDPKFRDRVGLVDLLYGPNIESAAMVGGGNAKNYEPGKAKLMELKKLGVKVYPSNETLAAALKNEEIWITIMWRARAVQWKKAGIPVAFAAPREGVTPIIFEMAVPKNAPDRDCALRYLDAALTPQAQVGFADKMGYVPTVANATLPPELKQELDFTPEQQATFFIPDFDYLAKNNAQLLEWWNKEFKA